MDNRFSRTENLIGSQSVLKLSKARVAIFGIGGVGGYVLEALVRSGVGNIDIIDKDEVDSSNINRQIIALTSTIGMPKVEVAKKRALDINPECNVNAYRLFYLPETKDQFDFSKYDYVVDAIDTVTGKLALIEEAKRCSTPIISSMGAGNKLDPTAFKVSDIFETKVCPLAKVMRKELKKRNIDNLKVVYSEEEPKGGISDTAENLIASRRSIPASIAFVPSVVGLIIAGEVIKDLIKE